jgi:hypothetical protein
MHSLTSHDIRFDPPDWEEFLTERGWRLKEMRYLGEESQAVRRPTMVERRQRPASRLFDRGVWRFGYQVRPLSATTEEAEPP